MARQKVSMELDMNIDEIEDIFKRPVIVDPVRKRVYGMIIHKNLTPNRMGVINLCKLALVKDFGTAKASRYIQFRETNDARGIQYWLRYQIESTAYPDTYCLSVDAQKWFNRHPQEAPQG